MRAYRSLVWQLFTLFWLIWMTFYAWDFHRLNGPPPDFLSWVIDATIVLLPPLLLLGAIWTVRKLAVRNRVPA
jgi:hypothetical protein